LLFAALTMNKLQKGWYSEINEQWPGQAMSLEVEEVLWDKQSPYQRVGMLKTKTWGHALIIDGVIQCTERDEMAYQEMITHIPMFAHKNPKNVLVVGGGDGGVLREVLKHKTVEHVTICEIDQMVIDVSKKWLPKMACAYDDPRVTLHCGDAAVFIKGNKNKFDVIVCDSSDPVGPAKALFERPFFMDMKAALRKGGRIATQGESMWINLDLITGLIKSLSPHFTSVEYGTTQIPTYPAGQIGFIVCGWDGDDKEPQSTSQKQPARAVPDDMELNYYNTPLHTAAFTLPSFCQRAVDAAKDGKGPAKKKQKTASKKGSKKGAAAEADEKEEKVEEPAAKPAGRGRGKKAAAPKKEPAAEPAAEAEPRAGRGGKKGSKKAASKKGSKKGGAVAAAAGRPKRKRAGS